MKDNAFTVSMNKIAAEAEAEQILERRQMHRRQRNAKIFFWVKCVLVLAIFGGLFAYRVELQTYVSENLLADPKPAIDSKTGAALAGIQENAVKRDKALETLLK